jgi:hypothetical protein
MKECNKGQGLNGMVACVNACLRTAESSTFVFLNYEPSYLSYLIGQQLARLIVGQHL